MIYKLGKLPPRHDPRTLKLANYLRLSRLVTAPASCDWDARVKTYPMFRNDEYGCCALAGPGHSIQTWTANAGTEFIPTDADVLRAYSDVGGWKGTPETDNGCVLLDVMRYLQRTGIAGHKIGAYAQINIADHAEVCAAIWLFGGITIGLRLPIAAQAQEIWQAPSRFHQVGQWAPGSWGGHCVIINQFNPTMVPCVTWGAIKQMDWSFFDAYCDEAWVMLSPDWFNGAKVAPNGFNLAALQADLAAVSNMRAPAVSDIVDETLSTITVTLRGRLSSVAIPGYTILKQ